MPSLFTHREFALRDTPPLDGRGGQGGIGRGKHLETLSYHGSSMYDESRDITTSHERQYRHISLDKNDKSVVFAQCDLANIFAVKEVADQVKRMTERPDVIICNGGLGITSKYGRSPQDVEMVSAANCVGHQLLVTLLLPFLKHTATKHKSTKARFVVTSPCLHSFCHEPDLDQLTTPIRPKSQSPYIDGLWRYSRSKLGNILLTKEISRRLQQDDSAGDNVYDEHYGKVLRAAFRYIFSIIGQSTQDGAATAMYLAASDKIRVDGIRGQYYIPIAKPCATTGIADELVLARKLWVWVDARATEHLGPNWQPEA
ncbi:hypothetical protein BO78DRAFT_405281 [Aspergillus sclerotiicarbonarius CBS 121057]|uniref:Uncharacterized protein n=1 Tax=Aspergillus sclerotiicarbonarius (strain CBS 121057 / IBT 28362) TaxID=1448318 RepID=A0A319EHH2_ASPSB|nr:hypothetical protein BO78DRAFT_405281 [Aspergillus sclerotiicarbonarius CBS 121057]